MLLKIYLASNKTNMKDLTYRDIEIEGMKEILKDKELKIRELEKRIRELRRKLKDNGLDDN